MLQRRSKNCPDNQGAWQFGGGKLEFGESIEEWVLREVKEEYGCVGVVDVVLPPRSFINERDNLRLHWITLPHIMHINEDEAKLNEPGKAEAIGWFALNDLPSPLHSGTTMFLKEHKEILTHYKFGSCSGTLA